ncbi:MAG: type II secretion system F family protein, partial [Planctomycetota bacterium]
MIGLIVSSMPIFLLVSVYYAESAAASTWSLAHFTNFLSAMVRQNLPLGSSLSAYAKDLSGWRWGKRKVLLDLADTVDNGLFLADALDRHPAVFPGYYRALVRAGENGGNLASVLDRLREAAEFGGKAIRRAAGHAMYPAGLATTVLSMTGLMAVFVVPKFHMMFEEAGLTAEDGSPIALLMRSWTMARIGFPVIIGIPLLATVGLVGGRRLAKAVPVLAAAWGWLTWHLPLVGRYERRRVVSQYALASGRLMEAGIPTHEAVEIAARAGANAHFEGMALAAAAHVADGREL